MSHLLAKRLGDDLMHDGTYGRSREGGLCICMAGLLGLSLIYRSTDDDT